ncbi:hypothetical protein TELCIR_13869 [Teladorsagia circumcincta]|uniref:Uncharacterized protein n=1 Tax=Teladorsagia circumcincta TaxID=45464 RepID=A0A2G9U2T7_TELCI|nr:hypothetical protein TELCIR_13869 [Teladorsagia circumcincta]
MDIFGELLTTSGLIVDDRITWLTFSSGYDFGYLLKSITLGELPKEESQFFQFHRALFPRCYDIKLMLRMPGSFNTKLKGGLQEVINPSLPVTALLHTTAMLFLLRLLPAVSILRLLPANS